MKKKVQALILASLGICSLCSTTYAANVYDLNPVTVTAQRVASHDLDTPASVEVVSREKIEQTGGGNAFEVLRNTLGVFASTQLPNGVSMGSMTSKINIRGVDKGTLVLVDGVPINQDGKYNLEDIGAEAIDHIEIVRGGGSVLYGSEATGGVINIITRSHLKNSVKVSAGNYDRQRYAVTAGTDRFNISAYAENRGAINHATSTVLVPAMKKTSNRWYNYKEGQDRGVYWNYQLTDKLKFSHNYVHTKNTATLSDDSYKGGLYQAKKYEDHNNTFLLNYDDHDGLTAFASYGTQERNYDQDTYNKKTGAISESGLYSWRKSHSTNLNIQKEFDLAGENKFLIGASFNREDLDIKSAGTKKMGSRPAQPPKKGAYERDVYSLYTSYNWKMNERDRLIFNARETFVRRADGSSTNMTDGTVTDSVQKNQNKFTPEIQYLRKLNDNASFYAKAGKSFRLPELTKLFGGAAMLPSLDLKPEHGTHYEMGYKLNRGNISWRAAIFHYDIKDSIQSIKGVSPLTGDMQYINTDSKNTGIELSAEIRHNENWNSTWGISYSNPQERTVDENGMAGGWIHTNNRIQFTSGINYHKDKWSSSLTANYLGCRYKKEDDGKTKVKPALFTDLDISYKPGEAHRIFLHINNVLDRDDYTTATAPNETTYAYIAQGRNFMLGYEFQF